MVATLREHRTRQDAERAAAGARWRETDLVFTTESGTPLEPNDFSRSFVRTCQRAGLRDIRLHDLRHTYAHVMLDAQREALRGLDGLFDE